MTTKTDFIKTITSGSFKVMAQIEARAHELIEQAIKEKGEFGGYTFCAGHVGFIYPRRLWRLAKEAGFHRTADRRWVGYTSCWNGEFAIAEVSYCQALNEKKVELGESFLDKVGIYEYLT